MADAGAFIGKSWSDRFESIFADLAGEIPEVGIVFEVLISLFWPGEGESTEGLLEQMKTEIEREIDEKNLTTEMGTVKGNLLHLKHMRDDFDTVKSADNLKAVIDAADTALSTLQGYSWKLDDPPSQPLTPEGVQLFGWWVSVANLDLAVQRMRLKEGSKYYTPPPTEAWTSEMQDRLAVYQGYFGRVAVDYPAWRATQLSVKQSVANDGYPYQEWMGTVEVNDPVSGEDFTLASQTPFNDQADATTKTNQVAAAVKARFASDAIAALGNGLIGAAGLHRYVPGREKEPLDLLPGLDLIDRGPYCPATAGVEAGFDQATEYTFSDLLNGTVTGLNVWAGDWVDGFQLVHTGGITGDLSGTTTGAAHKISVTEGAHLTGLDVAFDARVMYQLQPTQAQFGVKVIDLPSYGNTRGWSGGARSISMSSPYALVGAEYAMADPVDGARGTAVLGARFVHTSLLGSAYPALGWEKVVGAVDQDIAIGESGAMWAVNSAHQIFGWTGDTWIESESCPRGEWIAVDEAGVPIVIDTDGALHRRSTADPADRAAPWSSLPKPPSKPVAMSRNAAGTNWIIGEDGSLYLPLNDSYEKLTVAADGASMISIDANQMAFAVTKTGALRRADYGPSYDGPVWADFPSPTHPWDTDTPVLVSDIAAANYKNGMLWAIDTTGAIWHWRKDHWKLTAGTAFRVATDTLGRAVVLQSNGGIYRRGIIS